MNDTAAEKGEKQRQLTRKEREQVVNTETIQSKSSFIQVVTIPKQDDEEEVCLNLNHNRGEQRRTYKHYQPQISNQLELHLIPPDSIVDSVNLRSETYVQGRYTLIQLHTNGDGFTDSYSVSCRIDPFPICHNWLTTGSTVLVVT